MTSYPQLALGTLTSTLVSRQTMPLHFQDPKISSFYRQLSFYGFKKVSKERRPAFVLSVTLAVLMILEGFTIGLAKSFTGAVLRTYVN